MQRYLLSAFVLLSTLLSIAQQGSISGIVTTTEAGRVEPLPFVSVVIKGTTIGASTDLDGNYFFTAEPGEHLVAVSFVGYQTVERNVTLAPRGTVTVDVEMANDGVQMEEFTVVESLDRERESVLLMERKENNDLVQNIGAQELKKKGASDVAEGVQKIVGLSTVGGKYMVVRGLGDRYNAAYFNGLPLPSPDPDTKVAPLDIFPTQVVGSINVTKGFTPEFYGDFSGGAVDIRTKRATGENILQISLGTGMNTQTTFKNFTTYNGSKHDHWGLDDGTRAMPAGVLGASSAINGERLKFRPNFNPIIRKAGPDVNYGIYGGTTFSLAQNVKLNILATANYRNENRYREGKVRVINTLNQPMLDYDQKRWQFNTQSSALASLSLELGRNHSISYTSTWVNLSSDEVQENRGTHFDYQDHVLSRRETFRQNSMFINQVAGEHAFGNADRMKVEWAGSMSKADANEPDRKQLVYLYSPDNGGENYRFNAIDRLENHRRYSALEEKETSARAGVSYRLLQKETEQGVVPILTLRTGAQLKRKSRNFGYSIFSYDLNGINANNPDGIDVNSPDRYLDNANYTAGNFSIANVTGPEAEHTIKQDINAAYLTAELDIVPEKLKVMGGARMEDGEQFIVYRKQSDSFYQARRIARINSTDLLPFAAIKFDLDPTNVIRANASKTISRPGFREMAPFEYTEFFAGAKFVGNPDLKNGTNYNADLRYEIFPNSGEVIAIGVFGKQLIDPIEKVALATASGQLQSFRNTGSATVVGVELELIKNIGTLLGKDSTCWNNFSVGINATFMQSRLTISDAPTNSESATVVLTNTKRPLQGASPYLLNADLSYQVTLSKQVKGTLTVAYNIFGRRVFSAGANGLGDQYEMPVGLMNVIARADIGKRWQANINFRNVLNPLVRIEQETPNGTSLLNEYRTGINISAGVAFRIL